MSIKSILLLLFRFVFWAFVISTPILAVWLASSLAIYLNGPVWLAVCTGALLFPGIPLIWDAWASRRFAIKQGKRAQNNKEPRERILRFGDRLILRTLTINIAFVAVLLGLFPTHAFTALSARGDWPLDHVEETSLVEDTRSVVFTVAESMEWLHNWARDNPYELDDDGTTPDPDEIDFGEVDQTDRDDSEPDSKDDKPTDTDEPRPDESDEDDPETELTLENGAAWPLPNKIHPVVAEMPESAKTDIASVANYIAQREDNPFARVKALHDFVAERTAYDIKTLGVGQHAESVFERKTAVCEGYARLLVELGREAGAEILYITGVSRDMGGNIAGGGHAWNAARIEGKWYLIDATWNAGYSNGGVFTKEYRTDYLFTPPDIFAVDHLPDSDKWQLLAEPISRGEFVRRPMMRTGFHRQGLKLVTPQRAQISVGKEAEIVLENPKRKRLLATVYSTGGREVSKCDVLPRKDTETVNCSIPNNGKFQIRLFAGDPELRSFPFVGQIEVVR